jgi:hypothetical protein
MTVVQDPRIDAHALDGRGRTAKQVAEQAGHAQIVALLEQLPS